MKKNQGFTLTELMVVVAVIGILGAVVISNSGNEWRRERVNTVAFELAGWLDAARKAALKGNACQVRITGGTFSAGQVIATTTEVVPAGGASIQNNCLVNFDRMAITSTATNSGAYTIGPTGPTIFKFTPRGSVNAQATDAQLNSPIEITISLPGGPQRCVRISPGLGLVSIGGSSAENGTCANYGGLL